MSEQQDGKLLETNEDIDIEEHFYHTSESLEDEKLSYPTDPLEE